MAITNCNLRDEVSVSISAPSVQVDPEVGASAKVTTAFSAFNDFSISVESTVTFPDYLNYHTTSLSDNPEFVRAIKDDMTVKFGRCIKSLQNLLPEKEKNKMDILDSIPNSSSIENINMPVENMLQLIAVAINAVVRKEEGKDNKDFDVIVVDSPKYPKAWTITFQNSKKNYDVIERFHYPLLNTYLKSKGWEVEHINRTPNQRDNPHTASFTLRAKEKTE